MKHLESFQLVQEKEQPVPSLTVHFGTRVLAFAAGSSVVFREKHVGGLVWCHCKASSKTFNKGVWVA